MFVHWAFATGERTIQKGRYLQRGEVFLDLDNGYSNTYSVWDGEKLTGISINKSSEDNQYSVNIRFDGREFPTLREAIYAYEDQPA